MSDTPEMKIEIVKSADNNPVAEFFSSSSTPETDKAERMAFAQEYMVPTEFARKLERERDEAREQINNLQDQLYVAMKAIKRLEEQIYELKS